MAWKFLGFYFPPRVKKDTDLELHSKYSTKVSSMIVWNKFVSFPVVFPGSIMQCMSIMNSTNIFSEQVNESVQ